MKVFVISKKAALNSEKGYCPLWTEHRYGNSEREADSQFPLRSTVRHLLLNKKIIPYYKQKEWRKCELKKKKSELYRNEIKSYIVRAGMTMSEVVDYLADEYGWSSSVPNLSGKLKRGSLRYGEAVELADALGYDIVWIKRG